MLQHFLVSCLLKRQAKLKNMFRDFDLVFLYLIKLHPLLKRRINVFFLLLTKKHRALFLSFRRSSTNPTEKMNGRIVRLLSQDDDGKTCFYRMEIYKKEEKKAAAARKFFPTMECLDSFNISLYNSEKNLFSYYS